MRKRHIKANETDRQDLLSRYLNGTCTDKEKAVVEQWYNLRLSEKVTVPDQADFRAIKDEIWQGINKKDAIIRPLSYKLVGMAAAVILFLAVSITLISIKFSKNGDTETWVKIKAPAGKVIKADLPDGSKVWLNAGSTLAYSPSFGEENRTVQLTDGEAYFDVVHDKHKPFVVLSGKIKTQVLGTSFNIRAASETKKITVSVIGGKVAVIKRGAAPLFLLPNQQADFNKETGDMKKSTVMAGNMTGWIAGKFRFNNEDLEVIACELQRRYGVNFVFKSDALRSIRFNAGFNANDSLNDVLNDLAKTGNISYVIQGKKVIISGSKKTMSSQ